MTRSPRPLASTLFFLALLTACGPEVDAVARAEGPFVVVEVRSALPGDVIRVGDARLEVAEGGVGFPTLRLGAETLGVGEHTVTVLLNRAGDEGEGSARVTVEAKNVAPQVILGPCITAPADADPEKAKGRDRETLIVTFSSAAWTTINGSLNPSGGGEKCLVRESVLKVPVVTHNDATVSLFGAPLPLVEGVWSVELGLFGGGLPLTVFAEAKESAEPVRAELTLTVARPGMEPVTVPVAAELRRASLRDAMSARLAKLSSGEAPVWPRTPHTGPARAILLTTVGAEVTVDGEKILALPRAYAAPLVTPMDPSLTASEVDLFAVARPVNVTDAGACTGYSMVLSGGGVPRSVLYGMGLEVVVRDAAGAELARKTFPGPAKPRCPDSLVGVGGKTTVLFDTPDPGDVLTWLESVRTGG